MEARVERQQLAAAVFVLCNPRTPPRLRASSHGNLGVDLSKGQYFASAMYPKYVAAAAAARLSLPPSIPELATCVSRVYKPLYQRVSAASATIVAVLARRSWQWGQQRDLGVGESRMSRVGPELSEALVAMSTTHC